MFTNGSHGGKYSLKSHLNPLPVLGSVKNLIRKTSGITNTDIQNKRYNELRKRIITLSQENDKTIFVSGHDHNLQYIVQDNLPQIVSGSGSKTTPTKLSKNAKYDFDLLKSVGIFHDTPESAAIHLTEVWDDIDSWWKDKKLQDT